MGAGASLRLFENGNFRALWVGQLISVFGDRFTYLALLALAVERARDPANPAAELSLIPVVSFLPAILFSPWVGALVDGWNTRRVLIVSDAARGAIVLLLIPAAIWGGLPAAFVLVFLLYLANAFFLPARSAILPDLVPADRLTEANSLATLAGVIATIAGSLAAGALVERLGWRIGFALDAATYFVSVVALVLIRPPARPPRAPGPAASGAGAYRALWRDVREGARIATGSRAVIVAIGAVVLLWMAGGALHVALPLLLERRGGGVVSGVGTILAATATGMVVGTLALAARGGRSERGRIVGGLAGAGVCVALFAASRGRAGDLAAAFGVGIFVSVLLVTTEAAIQGAVPVEARARVFALRDFAARLLVLGAAGLAGTALARGWTVPGSTVIAAGALLAAGGLALALLGRGRRAA
jgi:predicted MFS family arabinose efflux permease